METIRNISGYHLAKHQNEFILKFLNPDSSPYHLLIAPPGSGKTTVSCVITSETVKLGAKRILILVPARALMDQYKQVLSNLLTDIKIVNLDRKTIREIESLNKQETFWTNTIALATFQMAAISEEIRDNIFSAPWDLIVIDDIGDFPKSDSRMGFVKSILEKQIAKRFLILSDPNVGVNISGGSINIFDDAIFNKLEVTQWSNKDIFVINKGSRGLNINIVNYERSVEEVNFIKKYTSLSKRLSNRKLESEIRSRLLSSSLYAANESLRGLRNRLVHGDLSSLMSVEDNESEFIKDEELLGDVNTNNFDMDFSDAELMNLIRESEDALNSLDQTQVDSKLNALLELFANKNLHKSRTWVYASYLSTGSYLYTSLSEKFSNIYQVSSHMEYGSYANTLESFRTNGGTLIASAHILKGVNLPISNIVLYDIPKSKELLYVILTRAHWTTVPKDLEGGVSVFTLNDTSEAIVSETNRLQDFQKFAERFVSDES